MIFTNVFFIFSVLTFVFLYYGCAKEIIFYYKDHLYTHGSQSNLKTNTSRLYNDTGFYISGSLDWYIDLNEKVMIQLTISRSKNENGPFTPTWSVPWKTAESFIKSEYKDLRKYLGDCTDLPTYDEVLKSPWPKRKYHFNYCSVSDLVRQYGKKKVYYRANIIISALPEFQKNDTFTVAFFT